MYFWNKLLCLLGYHSWVNGYSNTRTDMYERCEHCGIEDDVDLPD
jgi:hypothetical protein